MQPSHFTVGLESATEHVPACRIPSWEGEHRGIKGNEGQMHLDVESPCVQSDQIPDGSMQDRPICLTPNKTTPKVLQLEARPRGREDRYLQPELVDRKVLCQPTMLPDTSTDGKDGDNHPTVELPTMVSNHLGLLEYFPRLLPVRADLVILPTDQEFIMKQRVPELVAWPISGNPLHHKESLQRLQTSFYPPGELRPSRTITHCLPNGQIGISNGTGIPLLDL